MRGSFEVLRSNLGAGLDQLRRETGALGEALLARNRDRICRDIKYELAAARFQTALIADAHLCRKAGFRWDQPRWPQGTSGTPKPGGRWSGGPGTAPKSNEPSSSPRSRGHHNVPGELYRNEPLQKETRRIFQKDTTGPIGDEPHRFDKEHRQYNKAVKDAFDRFKTENGISRSEDMTPEQAKKFLEGIRRTSDPHIRNLTMKIVMRQLRFYIRRGGRGSE